MKQFWKPMMLCAVAATMLPLVSCSDDDDTMDPYATNFVYFIEPEQTFATVEYKYNLDFISGLTDPLELVPVRLTKPAPVDMDVHMEIDPSLVAEFNASSAAGGKEYILLENAQLAQSVMHIAKGKYITEAPIAVDFTDHTGFTKGSDLVLPIVIKSVNGGAVISKRSRVFLTFSSTYRDNVVTIESKNVIVNATGDDWQQELVNFVVEDFITASWAADDPIKIDFAIDNSLVTKYNQVNDTEHIVMSGATIDVNSVTLQGESKFDLPMKPGDLSELADNKTYALGIKVNSFSGDGARLADGSNEVILVFTSIPPTITYVNNVSQLESIYGLTLVNYDDSMGWTATVNGNSEVNGINLANLFGTSLPSVTLAKDDEMIIDFGSTRTVGALGLQWMSYIYKIRILSIETSPNGTSWVDWGQSTATGYMTTDYYAFSTLAKCRYVKIHMITPYNSRYTPTLRRVLVYQ